MKKEFVTQENLVVRQHAHPIVHVADPEVQQLVDDLIETITGIYVGMAAPQIGVSKRVVVVAPSPNPEFPETEKLDPRVMINPSIEKMSIEKISFWEGCASVPNLRGKVFRHKWITVSYQDRIGNFRKETYQDFTSIIIQHEIDHLNGILFTDHVNPRDIISEEEFQKRRKNLE